MNKHMHTPFEPAGQTRETALSTAFATLLPALAEYVRAERDLEDIGYSLDPAYSEWHRESEAAQDRLIDLLHDLRTAPLGIAMDAPLRKMALMIHAMRCDPERARDLHWRMDARFEAQFRVTGMGPMAQHRKVLLNWARPLIASFVALPIFDQVEESTSPYDRDDGATPMV